MLNIRDPEAEMLTLIRTIMLGAGLALALGPATLFAGGDDYDAMADSEGKGPAYFGFVRDARGSPVSNARVVLQPKAGEAVVLKSNVLGLYRSHINKDVRPDDVVVSCDKAGYQQTGVQRRGQGSAANVEINCTLRRL
jgi:hypothetical protein